MNLSGFTPRSFPFPAGGTTAGGGTGGTGGTGGGPPGGGPGPAPGPGGGGGTGGGGPPGPPGCPRPGPPGGGGPGEVGVVGCGVAAWELGTGVPGYGGSPPTSGIDAREMSGFWREPSANTDASARRNWEGRRYPADEKKLSPGLGILEPAKVSSAGGFSILVRVRVVMKVAA
jgi:hypothetical protein